MELQSKLDKAAENYWAKFVTSFEQIGKYKQLTNDRVNLLNSYFESFGFSGIDDNWHKISNKNALDCLTYIISTSIPYGDEVLSPKEANNIAKEFISKFGDNPKIFTNVIPNSWEPFKLSPSWSASWNYEDYEDERGLGYLNCIAIIIYNKNNIGALCKLESD